MLPLTHRLNHSNHKVTLELAAITLHYTHGGARAKLVDALTPLVRQKLLVNNNHRSDSQPSRNRKCNCGLSEPARERKNPATFRPTEAIHCFILARLVA
jgi:hypothetical protein